MSLHPSQAIIRDFLSGLLSERRIMEIERHLDSCETCCVKLETISTTDGFSAKVKQACQTVSPLLGRHSVIDDYQIDERIGVGGMGIVYRARHLQMDRTVAVKILLPALTAATEQVQRFQQEVKATASLEHEHIVSVYSVGLWDGSPYFAMQYVPGANLAEVLRDRPLTNCDAASYLLPIAEAVHYAHLHGVLHRDIKPHNILLDDENKPLITDFGLAKILDGSQALTHSGNLMGTPTYMAPEHIRDAAAVGTASDVYGLGATLYHMLTGHPPFLAATVPETVHQVLEHEPVAPRRLNDAVDRDLETICLKCLDKEPQKRFASASELAADLQRYLNGEPIRARRQGAIERVARWRRRHHWTAVAIALLILVGLVGSVLIHSTLRQQEERLQRSEFRASAKERFLALDRELSTQLEFLRLVRAWLEIENPGREEFQQYALAITGQDSSIHALEWIPRVSAGERLEHEQQAVADGLPEYRIRWQMPDGELVPAGERDEYFPIFFVAPRADNQQVLGYDLSSESSRMAALNEAQSTNRTTVTPPIQLVQDLSRRVAIRAILPVFRGASVDESGTRESLAGFVAGVYRVEDLVQAARQNTRGRQARLTLVDVSGTECKVLYADPAEDTPVAITEQFEFESGGRQWIARFESAARTSPGRYEPLIAMLCGFSLTMLVAAALVLSTK